MKIACPHCRAAFALDDKRVPVAGLSIKCPKCKQPFAVHRPKPEDEGKIVEGKPLPAVPLPGTARPKTSPGLQPADDERMVVDAQVPAGLRDNNPNAIPLPGGPGSEPPPPVPAPPPSRAAPDFGDAIPLPGARDDSDAPAGSLASQPASTGYASIEAASGMGVAQTPYDPKATGSARPPGLTDDPFANIDIEVPDEGGAGQPSLDLDTGAPPPLASAADFLAPAAAANGAPNGAMPVDDPFGLDLPEKPIAGAPGGDPNLNYDFVDPAKGQPGAAVPSTRPPGTPGLLDFVDEGKAAPKLSPRIGRPPPMIAPGATAPADGGTTSELPPADAQGTPAGEPEKKPKREKKPKPPKEPGEPLGPRLQQAFKPVIEGLINIRSSPGAMVGVGIAVLLLVFVGFGIHAGATSSGLFWKNLWTPSGKQQSAAAREALGRGEALLADGSFSAAREAMGTAARTLQALPDDDDARAFFVLCASELKIGWGATGGDWDQATHVVEKLQDNKPTSQRAIGAFALASGDMAKAKTMLAPLGDAPNASSEAVWLYSQALIKGGEPAHAAQVLDNALKSLATVKLLFLRGQVERIRGKNDEAAKMFEQALAKAPNSGRALVEVADVHLKAGDYAGASSLLERALAPDVHSQLDATEDGRASMLRAHLAELQHNWPEAELQHERATKLDPSSADAFAAYGQFRLRRHEFEKAAKQFDLALAIDGRNPETLGNAARAYLGANRYLDADKRIREALDKQPKNARLVYVSGKVAETIGKTEEATKEYDRAIALKPDLPEVLIAQAQMALAAGDKDAAHDKADAAEKAPVADKSALDYENLTDLWLQLGDTAKAKADAAAAQALDPDDPYSDFAMGKTLAGGGDLASARALYEKALGHVDGDAFMHYELGSLLRQQGNLAAARKELEKATAIDQKSSRFHARLGATIFEQGEVATAETELKQSILMDDRNPEGLFFLGRVYAAEKKLPDAIETLKKAIEADPKNAQYDYQLGLAYAAGGQLVPAGDSFEKSTAKDPKIADAWEQLGLTDMAQNLFEPAMTAFRKALALEPERARSWAEIGDAELQMGNLDKAIDNLQKSVKLDAGQAPVWAKLGVAFRDRACDSCKTRAIEALRKSIQIAPKDPGAYREIGYIYKDDHKRADAISSFKHYLELKPDANDADSVKDDIFYLQEEGKRAP